MPGKQIAYLWSLAEQHLAHHANRSAVNDGELSYTFAELEREANIIANKLKGLDVTQGDRVVVLANSTALMLPIAIAIWKRGAIYAPVDPNLPEERYTAIINNITPKTVLAPNTLEAKQSARNFVEISPQAHHVEEVTATSELPLGDENMPAIIIHTSGTTGLPKGVVLSNKSVISYFESHSKVFSHGSDTRALNTASFHYDVSLQDTFMPIYKGGYVYINKLPFLSSIILPLIEREGITHITAVSTVLAIITGSEENLSKYDLSKVRTISTGAEVCDPKIIAAWLSTKEDIIVVNGYGPSEVNSATVSYVITPDTPLQSEYYPIGKPHEGVASLLVDDTDKRIDKSNVTGELLLGGEQLMLGYWNNESATKQAFTEIDGRKYYRTGDICYLDKNADLVFQGRKDMEVKIAGRRINLLEVAEKLNSREEIVGANVGVIDNRGRRDIFAMFSASRHLGKDDMQRIKEMLVKAFPSYMVPTYLAFLQRPQVGHTGKADLRKLTDGLQHAINDSNSQFFIVDDETSFNAVD
jgi:amino acid adenylation domain-containing protein